MSNNNFIAVDGLSTVVISPYEGEQPLTEARTVTPTKQTQEITSDSAIYLSKVTVQPIPSDFIKPTGQLEITSNGEIDVTQYSTVNVNVPSGGGGDDNTKITYVMPTDFNDFHGSGEKLINFTYSNHDIGVVKKSIINVAFIYTNGNGHDYWVTLPMMYCSDDNGNPVFSTWFYDPIDGRSIVSLEFSNEYTIYRMSWHFMNTPLESEKVSMAGMTVVESLT